jgi:hypothetical protein
VEVAVILMLLIILLAGFPIGLKAWPVVASRREIIGREYIMLDSEGIFDYLTLKATRSNGTLFFC